MGRKKGCIPWNKGKTSWSKGKHFTEKHKNRISEAIKKHPSGFKKGHIPWNTGKQWSEEIKGKIRESHKNNEGQIPWNKGKTNVYSEEILLKMSEAQRGEKGHNWKGGISECYTKYLSQRKWRKLANKIRKRDNYICQQCGEYPAYDVHHIIPFRLFHNDNENNLTTLCKKCHGIIEGNIRFAEALQ